MITRRWAFLGATGLALAPLSPAGAQAVPLVEVWRDPNCGCCGGWVEHLRNAGFRVQDRVVPSVAPYRQMLGTPPDLLSCHAGRILGYALEGHVPIAAIQRLVSERPTDLKGLAVPGMPIGTPGMEVPGQPADVYDVVAFSPDGSSRPWMRFRGYDPVV